MRGDSPVAGDVYVYTSTWSGKATISLCAEAGKEPSIEKASLVIYDGDDFHSLGCEADKDCLDCEAVTLKSGQPIDLLVVTDPWGQDTSDLMLSVSCE